ncbi:multifunctional CCA addition/repair protein [Oceaniserpentilla sp. 4NH20-0058]|uniref:multifunctional CCA addition/repair protein n=1 Tax=Oceaniserpentilla sp. 4NH20-0058 TaxID=3127660 RepID=UPI0031062067
MNIYLVGGAVRDRILNITSKDNDWVVVGATPEELIDAGYKQVGADFPVFLHPKTQEEYALARTERKSGHGYQGFSVDFGKNVTLEEDLIRRDLTINAMAQDENGNIIDPFNGQQDIQNKILRHVSHAFCEDPLRVLRVARFAARFHHLGFRIADETISLMQHISASGELKHLTAERVWVETQRALHEKSPWVYFDTLKKCQGLKDTFTELDELFGIPQPEKHHPEIDTGLHSLLSLEQASLLSHEGDVRFAALMHDLGKGKTNPEKWPQHIAHETLGLKPIKAMCKRLRVPNAYKELTLKTCEYHTHIHRAFELKASTILKVLKQCDAIRKPERFAKLLLACEADAHGRTGLENTPYPQAPFMQRMLDACNQVNNQDIVATGVTGPELGQAIEQARLKAIAKQKELEKQSS